jgi:hypothetical protein
MNPQKPVNFPLRLPRSIDTELRQEANREGISINSVIVMHLARSLALKVQQNPVARVPRTRQRTTPKTGK